MKDYSKNAEDYLAEQVQVRGNIPAIAKAIDLPKAWLYKVAQGKIPNPQVNRVMKVLAHKESQEKILASNKSETR